jgi:uncharacterized protein
MSLNIRSSFKVNASTREAWKLLTDIERVAPCFPGAELGEALGEGMYRASFKVKLGPVSLTFGGKVGFVELSEQQGLAVIKASGTDTKGRGGAQGTVRCQLAPDAERTGVALDMSVDLSGSIAQYGRGQGMIADLTQQLVDRFAANLEALTAPAVAPAQTAAVSQPASTASVEKPPSNEVEVGGLIAGVFWRAVKRFFARLLGRAA